jgi:transposase
VTDAQWALIEPLLPLPKWLGRPELYSRRSIVDAILYVVRTGCSWRQLPVDFPPRQTVYWYFVRWNERGVTERIVDELFEQVRLAHGRKAEATAGIILPVRAGGDRRGRRRDRRSARPEEAVALVEDPDTGRAGARIMIRTMLDHYPRIGVQQEG